MEDTHSVPRTEDSFKAYIQAEIDKAEIVYKEAGRKIQWLHSMMQFIETGQVPDNTLNIEEGAQPAKLIRHQPSHPVTSDQQRIFEDEIERKVEGGIKVTLQSVLSAIEKCGRFVHKSELDEELKMAGFAGVTNMSARLHLWGTKGKMERIRYNYSTNNVYYGLAAYVKVVDGKKVLADEKFRPQGDTTTEINWDTGEFNWVSHMAK